MRRILHCTILFLTAAGIGACAPKNRPAATDGPVFPENPSREAYEGFYWEELSGAGIRLRTQRNDSLRIAIDDALPGARIERSGMPDRGKAVIRIFPLAHNRIEDVLELLRREEGWDPKQTCRFREVHSNRPGVRRYDLVPTGAYAEQVAEELAGEPVPSTCNGWGMGNSGIRYFEIHGNRPDRALFLEIGQDAPLFDERSIVFDAEADSTAVIRGRVVLAHEVRAFTPEGDTTEYWLQDRGGSLEKAYDRLTEGTKNGTPVRAELRVRYLGPSDEGFAAEYEGVCRVMEVIRLEREASDSI
ncbi:hypothetical protein [Alistipes sp.]|uniref:hypothetical protein n=1 Tax=Alistipes sp. TaxID=1872444 RepID=UPI0025B8718D|nr:hypothetical protein [Alistipes sp.]MCI7139625.1 hypothetical protein [Alistipes sp.]MDY5397006.1 hypothetical protein [Alistipes sp.]